MRMEFRNVERVALRSARNYDTDLVSYENGMRDDQEKNPSKTVQSEKDNCDINVIMKRFGVTGRLPVTTRIPSYGDYSGVMDYHSAMNAVRDGQNAFNDLPSATRARFGNDPQAFLEFCSEKENLPEMVKLGLLSQRELDILQPPKKEVPNGNVDDGVKGGSGTVKPPEAIGKRDA